jgi:hypothetical protein
LNSVGDCLRTWKHGQAGVVTGKITGEENLRAYSPPQQFRDDYRSLQAIADGAENCRAGIGAQSGSGFSVQGEN